MVTNSSLGVCQPNGAGETDPKTRSRSTKRRKGKRGKPHATVKFGSAVVPIYRSQSGGRIRYTISYHREAKRQDGMSDRYILQLRSNLRRLAGDFDLPITHVQRDQIDDWLRARKLKARSRNSLLTTIRVLFSFARKRSYLPSNEQTEAELVDKLKAPDVETGIFTPDEFRKLLHAAPPHLLPILVICGFAGMRRAEINRIDWNAVDLDRRLIEVRAGQAKTASRRIIPITDNLAAWLEPLPRTGPVVPTPDLHRQISELVRKVEIKWANNVLRHSFISYRIATVKSAEQVALEAGNSPAIIFKHYRELASEARADEWFGILPKEDQSKDVGVWKHRKPRKPRAKKNK